METQLEPGGSLPLPRAVPARSLGAGCESTAIVVLPWGPGKLLSSGFGAGVGAREEAP